MRAHVLTTVILAFADCLLCSESQETEHGPSQHLSPNAPLSSSPVKAVASEASLSQATNGNSSAPKEAVSYWSPIKVLRRRRPLYAGTNHSFPVGAVSRSYPPGPSAPMEGRSNSTNTETPQNPSSPISKTTLHYYDGSGETHPFRPISTVPQSSPPISRAASIFVPLHRTTHLSSPVSSITQPSALDSYTKSSSPRDSGATDLFLPVPRATRDSGSSFRETFGSPPDFGVMDYSVPTSSTTHLSMPTFRTRYRFTPAFTARFRSAPDSPATQNASHDNQAFPTKHVQKESSPPSSQTGFQEMTSLPLPRWPVPSQSLSKVLMMPGTTKQSAANPESSLKPVIRHSLSTLKGSSQSPFVPDSEDYSSSFSILLGHPRSTLVERNSFNVDQDKSSHLSIDPTSGLLPVKAARQSLPGNLPRTKVVWNKSRELKPHPLIPYNSFGKDRHLPVSGRRDASQSPWNTPTAPLYPQAKPSSSMFGDPPLSHFSSISEAPIRSTTDTIIRILDSNTPISSVNSNKDTPTVKSHEEEATTNVADFIIVGEDEEITALADATPWDKKASITAYHATGYFLNPENLANDFLKDSTNPLTGAHNFSDDDAYKEERKGDGMDLDNAVPKVIEDNTILMDNTDFLEEDFRALMNTLEFLGEDGSIVIYVPDWEEVYLTDDDDPVVLKEDGTEEGNTRSFTKGMISRTKPLFGINDAAMPMKNVIPFTIPREIPKDVAVPTSKAVGKDVAINPIDDATNSFPKMFVRKSSTPVAKKHLDFPTVDESSMPTGLPVTSEVNDILSIRDSEIPIQQIILTQFKPQIILPENEHNATGNSHTVLLENTTASDKKVTVYMTQLWGDNSVIKNYTTLTETNTTSPKGRMPSLTNVPTRPISDMSISMLGTANPLLNNPNVAAMKEAIIKAHYTITTMEDDPTMGKGQRILSGRVIPRSSTITPKKDIKVTLYGLPRTDETSADGDTASEGDISLSPKAGTAVEADRVILAEENTPNDNTIRTFILDDNDPKSAKDDSFLPQVNTAKHLVDRKKYATNPTQSDSRVAISIAYISPSMPDRTVTTLRKVYSTGSDDVIHFMEENPESEIKAPVPQMLRDAPNSREVISRSMDGGRNSNQAKTSTEEDPATENNLKPTEEYYGGSEKGIVSKGLPTSFAFESDNEAFDVDDSDTKGFYSFQKGYNTTIFPLGDRGTIPKGSRSSLTQVLDSRVDPTPLLYEMTDSNPNVLLISSMKNLKLMASRNTADVTTDGIEEIILKDKETATVKENDEVAEDVTFFLPDNSIPGIRRKDYIALSDTDYGPAVRPTTILLDDSIKPAVISTPLWSKTSVSTIIEVAMDSIIKPAEKAPPKETADSTLTMNYINAEHDSTIMEVADPAKPILLTANTFKPDSSSAKLQETFHEKEDTFLRATRQPLEPSKNSAKIKNAALPEWQITESYHNVLPSKSALFPAAFTMSMMEPISGEHKTISIVNGNHVTQKGGVSEVRRDGKSTILEGTSRITALPAFRENTVTVIDTTRDESENGETFEYEVVPYVERTTTTEGEYISNDDPFIDFSNPNDDLFDSLVTEDDSIFPETDGTSPSTDIFANPPNLNELSYEREAPLTDSMTTGAITQADRVTSAVANGVTLPGKDNNAKGWFIIPGVETALSTGDAPLVISETLSPLPDIKTIDEVADPGGQIFAYQRDPWALPQKKRLLKADPTSSGLFLSNFEDSASTTGNRAAITEMDSPDVPLVTPETLSLLSDVTADEAQVSVFTDEDPLADASIIVVSKVSEPMVENIETINEAAGPGGKIFAFQRDPWGLPQKKRFLKPDSTSSGLFLSNFEDSASTTGNRAAITEMDSPDVPLVTPETLSLLSDVTADEAQVSVFTDEDPLADASIIVASKVSEPMAENTETIYEAADPGGKIFAYQRDPWALPQKKRLLKADSTSSGLFLSNFEDSASTTGNRVAITEMDSPDVPLVTPETLSLLSDVTADEAQVSVFTDEDTLADASIIVASKVSEPMVKNTETLYEATDPGGQIFAYQRDPWGLPQKKRLLIADPTSSGLFLSNFEDSASTTGNRVAITEMDSSGAPLVTPKTLSLLPDVTADEAQVSVFTDEDPLADVSIIVASEVSEPMVENIETINEAADPGGHIFGSQRDPWSLLQESTVLAADSPTYRFSPTSSEHSSPSLAAIISLPVKDIPSSIDGPRDNSERLILKTVPSEEPSYTDVETTEKEIMTEAEGNLPYGMAYNDFVLGNAVNRTGVSATNFVLIPTDIKMAVDRESGALRKERAGIESHGTKSPTDTTNSKTVATGNLVEAIPDVQEVAFVEEKSREAGKVAASFLPDTRGLGNVRSYDALPVGDTNPFAGDSTASGTMPSRKTPASSENATGLTDHTSGAPATVTAAGVKTHTKESETAVAEITNSPNDILPVTSSSIPEAEGISHVDDGTETVTDWVTVAPVSNAYAEYTEAVNSQAISERNPSLSTGYGHQLSARHLTLLSDQLHTAHPAKEASVSNVIRTPTERRKIEAENPSTINNPNSPDTPIVAVTTIFQNTDTTVHVSGPEYDILTEKDSNHETKGGEEGDNDILEVANITPFLSHDSILQRDNLAPEGYLINSEDTVVTLNPNGFLTHMKYSVAKATNSAPETAASEFEEIVILEKEGLADTDTAFLLPDIPERKRNAIGNDPITQGRVKPHSASSRDLLLAFTKTDTLSSKERDSLDNKIAYGEDPNEMEKMQEAVAAPVTFFSTPEADSSHANTEPWMDVTATPHFEPTKKGVPDLSKTSTLHSGYLKAPNNSTTTISEADPTLASTSDTTLLTDDPLNFDPEATGISPETFHLKESLLDDATVSEASGPVSEKPLLVNGAPNPKWNVINAQKDPQDLQLESTLPPLPRTPAYTDTDTVGTVKEDPLTETGTSGEKDPSPKRANSAAAPFNWREDTDFTIRATLYEADVPVEKVTSDEYEKPFHREEEDARAEGDDIAQEGENIPYSTYSSPFMSGNNILEGKNLDPEDGSIFHETNSYYVITEAVNSPPQIIINEETKAGDSVSPRDKKPSTVGDSAAQTVDDNMKTITADGIPDRMIKMATQFKGITNTGQNYSEAENNSIFLPDVAYLPIKRKARKDGEVGPEVDSPLASKDTRFPMAGSTGPVPFATLPEGKVGSMLVPADHATNNVAGAKFPEQETKTATVEMVDSQNDISPVISFTGPADISMPYANKGNKYRKDLAVNAATPLTWKAPAMVAKDVMLPSEYIQPNNEFTASEVGTTMSTRGGPLTALTKPIHEHLAPSDKSQINHHGRERTPITFKTLEPGAENSLPNDAATMGQPLTKMKTDLPYLPLGPTLLPDDSSTSINKAIYTRHAAATARKEDARTAMVPDILITLTNHSRADTKDRINTSSYQPDIIIEESASMEYDEIPFVEEDTLREEDAIYLEEENNSNDDLMTLVLDNNVSAYVTEDYTIAPPSPIINTPTLTYEPSELGTYASYNKADSSYSSSEIATANPTQTNSTETSHTVIPEYEPPDSEIYTTMLKSVAPQTIAYASSDGSKKMSSRFLTATTKEQNNKVLDDANTILPAMSNPKIKRPDSSITLDPDTGFPIEERETFTMDNFGSAGEPAPIKNKEVTDTFTSGRNPGVTAIKEQYSIGNFRTVGSEIPTSQDSTRHSELLMSPETSRISHVDENLEMVTDTVTTANMPATGKVASVGVLPVQDSDSPAPKADVTMFLDNHPLPTHENPSLIPDAKTDSAAASLQGKNEALLDDFFLMSEEREIVVEQLETSIEDDTSVPKITLLSQDAKPLASEDNIIQAEESFSHDTDLIGGDKFNSEDNYIILEPNVSDMNTVMNSCLTKPNGLETIACMDSITVTEKNGKDEFYAKNLSADKAKVPMETIPMTDVITSGIKTTPQEITAVEERNMAAVKVTSFEPDVPHSETIVNNHKGSYIASDWDPIFTTTDTSIFMTGSIGLAEDVTSLKNQETSIPKDTRFSTYNTIDPRAEPMVTTTDATSEEKEDTEKAEITSLENDVTPMSSFISHKTKDTEPVTNSGKEEAITAEEEIPTPTFSASTLYTGYNKPEDDPIALRENSAPVPIDDTILLKDVTVANNQETLLSKEMSLGDADMTVSEVTGPVSEKPLPINRAPTPEWNVINTQSDPQALQLESTIPPADSTPLPRTPAYTDADIAGTVKEDPVTETATSGENYPFDKRAISAAATIINLREETDFMSKTATYETNISLEEIKYDGHEAAFHREEENAIAEDGVTQEENTPYNTDFSTYISSSNILKGNELDPQDYSIFPRREDVDSISEVNKITADLPKFAALPASPQNSIPITTSFPVPGADRISLGNKESETLSYSDLTGDMSFTAQADPTMTKVPIPTSLPSRSGDGDDFLVSKSGTVKCSEHTTPSVDTISILEGEFTNKKVQDTPLAKDGSFADLKMTKSHLLNLVTDHSAVMNNPGILEGLITKTPTQLHAFPLDAARENTVSTADSTYTEHAPSITREDTTSERSFDAIRTSLGSSSLEEMLPVTSAAEPLAEDPPPKIYSPTPTTDITRNIREETILSTGDDTTPKIQTAITSEGGHLRSLDDSTPKQSDVIATAIDFMMTFSDFISSVTDKLTHSKEIPTSEFNTKFHHIETPTADIAEGVSALSNAAMLSANTMPLTEEEVIPYETGSISPMSNDAFPVDDDEATDPANEVSAFMMQDLEEGKIAEFERTIPSEEDDPNAMATVNGFIQKDDITEEKDMLSVTHLTNFEEEDTAMSETSNSIEVDSVDDDWLWMEGNPDDELNATAHVLEVSKTKDRSAFFASGANDTEEDKNTLKTFLRKLVAGPTESVTTATAAYPGGPAEGRPTEPRGETTTETATGSLKQEGSKDTL